MNKNFILLLLLVIFTGCTGVQLEDNLTQATESDESVNISELEHILEEEKLVEEKEVEKVIDRPEIIKKPEVKEKLTVEDPVEKIIENEVIEKKVEQVNKNTKIQLYKHPFVLNGKNTNIQMYNTLEQLEENDFKIGITKEELLDTETFDFIFNSKPSSNGAVAKVSGRLYPILSIVYKFPMEAMENILYSDDLTCADSTLERKLVMFDSDYTSNEVLYDSVTGCIEFKTTSQELMGTLGDKFFYELFSN